VTSAAAAAHSGRASNLRRATMAYGRYARAVSTWAGCAEGTSQPARVRACSVRQIGSVNAAPRESARARAGIPRARCPGRPSSALRCTCCHRAWTVFLVRAHRGSNPPHAVEPHATGSAATLIHAPRPAVSSPRYTPPSSPASPSAPASAPRARPTPPRARDRLARCPAR
jgi:hypothetical protein